MRKHVEHASQSEERGKEMLGLECKEDCKVELTSKISVVSCLNSPGSLLSVKTSRMLNNFLQQPQILIVREVPFPSYLKMAE